MRIKDHWGEQRLFEQRALAAAVIIALLTLVLIGRLVVLQIARYVFYADGTFGLQFSSARAGFFEYRGRYTRTDARITFDWDGWSIAGPWGATGTLSGDTLRVEYNTIMQATDFVDGMYVRVPGTADGGDPCYGCWDY